MLLEVAHLEHRRARRRQAWPSLRRARASASRRPNGRAASPRRADTRARQRSSRMRTARRERAAGRQVGERRHHAGNFLQALGRVAVLAAHRRRAAGSRPSGRAYRDAAAARTGPRPAPPPPCGPAYITMTRCAVSATTPRSWVIRITAVPSLLLQVEDEVEDLRLDGDVERGGRLVGDQHLRIAGERHRDHGALAHAAGQLVRIFLARAAPAPGCAPAAASRPPCPSASPPADASRAAAATSAIWLPMVSTGLSEVIGSWKIIEMSLPRTCAHRLVVERQQVDAGELDRAADDAAGRIGHQPHQRQRGDALAAAGFADDRQRLAAAAARSSTPSTALTMPWRRWK